MGGTEKFCTCKNLECPLHPSRHDKGCSPCISKNLRTKEMPSCFFHLLKGGENRTGDSFEEFARLVVEQTSEDRNDTTK